MPPLLRKVKKKARNALLPLEIYCIRLWLCGLFPWARGGRNPKVPALRTKKGLRSGGEHNPFSVWYERPFAGSVKNQALLLCRLCIGAGFASGLAGRLAVLAGVFTILAIIFTVLANIFTILAVLALAGARLGLAVFGVASVVFLLLGTRGLSFTAAVAFYGGLCVY